MSNPRLAAQEILDKYWNKSFPVDAVRIARDMGIIVRSIPPHESDLSGRYEPAKMGQPATIYVNLSDSYYRQRFTVAHELGHHVLHGESNFRDPVHQPPGVFPAEIEANNFAAAILMPEYHIRRYFDGGISTEKLCKTFGVSKSALGWRLMNLGYRYD